MTSHPVNALRPGDRGPAVAAVCHRLMLTGDLPASFPLDDRRDVAYDATVEQAVRAFQQRRGLIVDGVVGRATFAVLDGAQWRLGDRVLRYTSGPALEGDDVGVLQRRLVQLGFSVGKVDGILGPETDAAIRTFQSAVGLAGDGVVGPGTIGAFEALRRSVGGGSATALREREQLRRSGPSLAGRTIVLDPGHGGGDPGVIGPDGLTEASVALGIAARVEARLSAHGVDVVFTHTAHTPGGSEDERAAFANDAGADLLITLHSDHSMQTSGHGVATFFYGHPDHGGWSTIGERFADLMLREVVARTGLTDCRSHARTWTLLRRTRMPAVRLDFGYLTHPGDCALLARPGILDGLAEGIVVALQRMYLGDADLGRTGMLRLSDLRRHLEAMSAGSSPPG
ncbi:N-acetylmuramoyl-L-alanine amidase [Intrasporangium sp.]|uniref:N-acetylmuramoyl-L-alanine amidase n=1 Tax=Intrasporangium sp. TaxID=1925024 RepID=UPI0032221A36